MKIIDGKIVLETEPCHWCNLGNPPTHPGMMPSTKRCPDCKGTRRGPRGGRGKCRRCLDGTTADFDNLVTCSVCNGTARVPETICSTITADQWQSMTFKVIREENGRFGFNESYLGIGYVSTCGDYGTAWERNNPQELLEYVKTHENYVQATKIAKDDGTVCDHIAILVSRRGYKIKAVFADENPADNSQADKQVRQMFDPRGLATAEVLTRMNR